MSRTPGAAQWIKGIKLQEDDFISSYGVKTLFTSVPIEPVIKMIKENLIQDN